MKNKLQRFMILVLALTIVSLMLVSGTYAKYTSSATGSDTATVAKWAIKVGSTSADTLITGSSSTVTFDLFSTIKDSNGTDAETDVSAGLIAPGTSGAFSLKVKNESEVTAEALVSLDITNANNVPIQFSLDGGSSWQDGTDGATLAPASGMTLAIGSAEQTIDVMWRWIFNGNDATDTGLGVAAQTSAPTVVVAASIVANQVD